MMKTKNVALFSLLSLSLTTIIIEMHLFPEPEVIAEKEIVEKLLDRGDSNTVHLMYGIGGNASDIHDEFEVSLKSVLMNAPADYPFAIHVLMDEGSKKEVDKLLIKTQLEGSHWKHSISLNFYVVTKDDERFMKDSILYWRNQSWKFSQRM